MLESLAASAIDEGHADTKDFVKTKWQYSHDVAMQNRQYRMQQGLNTQMANLSAEARRSSASDMVEGLKRAGLSPALATGTQFGAVGSGGSVSAPSSSPAPSSTSGMGRLALEDMKFKQSERELMAAQAESLRQEALGKKIDNTNKLDANDASNKVARDYFTDIVNSPNSSGEEKAFSNAMLSTPLSVGSLQGYDKVMESYPKSQDALRDKLKSQVEQQISQSQIWDKDFAPKVAEMPKEEVDKIREQTKNIAANSALLEAELSRTREDTEYIKKQQDLITAEIAQLYQAIRASKHADLIGMLDNGEYLNFAVGLGLSALPAAVHAVGGISAAKTLRGRSANAAFMSGLAQ